VRIGVDLGGTKIEAIAVDGRHTLARRRVPTPAGDYGATVDAVGALVEGLERAFGPAESVGVGTPGSSSPRTGLMRNSNSTVLNGRPLADDLRRRLGRELRIANDADCFALSEATDGAGAGAAVVFGVILGTGVGGGVVVDGRVRHGHNRVAGEWGHNPLPWQRPDEYPGPACYCGKRGCIETYLCGPALARAYAARSGRERSPREIAADEARDPAARATVEDYRDRLARGLAHVVNLLDPDVIVLGGGLSNSEALYRGLPAAIAGYAFTDTFDTPIVKNAHGDSSGVRGAAWLWG
jgi:fructokinase